MTDLLATTLFRLFAETSHEVTYDEIKNAYRDFVRQVEAISNSEPDYAEVMQHLNLARIEYPK